MENKRIICLIGKSGSGKTIAADYLQDTYKMKALESWTDRPERYPGEGSHTYITRTEFDKIKESDMIAYTKFGNNRYCCVHSDLEQNNIYVIDPTGLQGLITNFQGLYDIVSVYIHRDEHLRNVSQERKDRDNGMYFLPDDYYDYHIYNNDNIKTLHDTLDTIIQRIQIKRT